jgi:hypothetical protein
LIANEDMKPISPVAPTARPSAEHVRSGIPIPPAKRVTLFSPEEWESFTEEWASSLEDVYARVARFGGAGDQGVDVVGFISDTGWDGGWDNYQCKRYDHPLRPGDIWIEIGKIIYYSYKNDYCAPRNYYFVASQGLGTSLQKLLASPDKLKKGTKDNWREHCQNKITKTTSISLDGDFLAWLEVFDFSIFSTKSVVDLIAGHAKTQFYSIRFGGGLPPRPTGVLPPEEPEVVESRYIQQMFNAYSDNLGKAINHVSQLSSSLSNDFLRQRERFYHAESLRNFARDTVPDGTFESLQDEIFHGVIDICDSSHGDGLARMRAAIVQAANIATASNPLRSVVKVQDQQGICHQLANEDRLLWVYTSEEE